MYENDLTGELFASDAFLPAQYYESHNKEIEPERRLMLAMLADAVRCYQAGIATGSGERARLFTEAKQWLFTEQRNTPFSFDDVCGALDIDPEYLRRGLRCWRARRLANQKVPLVRRSPVVLGRHVIVRKYRAAAGHAGLAPGQRVPENTGGQCG